MKRKQTFAIVILGFCLPLLSVSPRAFGGSPTYELAGLRLAPLAAYQSGGGSTYTLLASWNPEMKIDDKIGVGLDLGGTVLQTVVGTSFLALQYKLTGSYRFSSDWGAELGAGLQTWVQNGTYALLSATGFYFFDAKQKPLGFLDRVLFGYGACFATAHFTSEITAGVGLSF